MQDNFIAKFLPNTDALFADQLFSKIEKYKIPKSLKCLVLSFDVGAIISFWAMTLNAKTDWCTFMHIFSIS